MEWKALQEKKTPISFLVGPTQPVISDKSFLIFRGRSRTTFVTPISMKNLILDSIQKNADLASIASVGAAVGIETLPVGHSWTELAQSVISLKNAMWMIW